MICTPESVLSRATTMRTCIVSTSTPHLFPSAHGSMPNIAPLMVMWGVLPKIPLYR